MGNLLSVCGSERDAADPEQIKALLKEYDQEHVLNYVPEGGTIPAALLKELGKVDFQRQKNLYEQVILSDIKLEAGDFRPAPGVTVLDGPGGEDKAKEYTATTLRAAAEGKLALLILAGGAGTRLGFDGPKGEYDIGLPSGRSLFQLHAERLHKLEMLADEAAGLAAGSTRIQLFVMTSPANDAETRRFFHEGNYFGLDSDHVYFFPQGTLPCFGEGGKLMLESPEHLAQAADGNGGLYPAMFNRGVMSLMKSKGIEYVQTICVDNALVQPLDPSFMGLVLSSKADVGSLVVPKRDWSEPIGMLVQNNGKYAVAEYSDVSDAMKKEKDANGNLKFIAGNICVHAFSLDFLYKKVVPEYIQKIIPANYHIARKQIPVWNAAQGKTVKPSEKNGIKLEMFIFDVFPLADSMAILQVDRSEQFSPVKNKPGPGVKDSPETALQMLGDLHAKWVKTAGAEISGSELAKLEVSPAASYEGEGLESLKGKTLEKPCIVESAKSAGKEAGSSELNGQNGINYYYV